MELPIPEHPERESTEFDEEALAASGRLGATSGVMSFALLALSWELTAAMFIGRWLFGPGWFGPHRELAALVVSLALSVYHRFWGRRLVRKQYRNTRTSLSVADVFVVIVLMLAGGIFGTWLFVRGPGR